MTKTVAAGERVTLPARPWTAARRKRLPLCTLAALAALLTACSAQPGAAPGRGAIPVTSTVHGTSSANPDPVHSHPGDWCGLSPETGFFTCAATEPHEPGWSFSAAGPALTGQGAGGISHGQVGVCGTGASGLQWGFMFGTTVESLDLSFPATSYAVRGKSWTIGPADGQVGFTLGPQNGATQWASRPADAPNAAPVTGQVSINSSGKGKWSVTAAGNGQQFHGTFEC